MSTQPKGKVHMEYYDCTRIARGAGPDPVTGALSTPIYRSATYHHPIHPEDEEKDKYTYARCETPTRHALEQTIAELEHGEGALGVSSGMAAISLIARLFVPGDHVIVSSDLYGGTYRLFTNVYGRYGISFEYVDTWKLEDVKAAIRPNTKAIYVETPTNPCLYVSDIRAIAELAKAAHALLIVDNTFLTPYFQKPLDLGADIVLHSATKGIAGHNDVLAGLIVTKERALREELYYYVMCEGNNLGADDAWLVLRGLETMAVRLDREQENAFALVDFLRTLPTVERVVYPGDPSHPQYALSKAQGTGFGTIISIYMKEASKVSSYLTKLQVINHGGSLGGVQSLAAQANTELQRPIAPELKAHTGVNDALIRLSVGIEDVRDLKADLAQALS